MCRDTVINDLGHVGGERRPFVMSLTNEQQVEWLADSGAAVTVINKTLCDRSAQNLLRQNGQQVQVHPTLASVQRLATDLQWLDSSG